MHHAMRHRQRPVDGQREKGGVTRGTVGGTSVAKRTIRRANLCYVAIYIVFFLFQFNILVEIVNHVAVA